MVSADNTNTTSVTAWAERTPWDRVMAGPDLGQAEAWSDDYPVNAGLDNWADPVAWAAPGDHAPSVRVTDDGEHLELVDGAERPLWWPGGARPADKLAAHAGVRGMTRAQAAEALNVTEDPTGWDWFWTGHPVLEAVRDAGDFRGVNRWGLLGAVLAWAAAHVPQECVLGGGDQSREAEASLNLFVAAVGKPGDGKGKSVKTAMAMLDWDQLRGGPQPGDTNSGSVEGLAALVSIKGDGQDGEDGEDGQDQARRSRPGENKSRRYLVKVPELSRLMGERRAASNGDSTQDGYLLSMWFGESLTANLSERTRYVPDQSYRMCIHVGAQPHLAYRLMADTSAGMAQRFLYFPALPWKSHEDRGESINSLPHVRLDTGVVNAAGPIPQDPEVTREVSRFARLRKYSTRDTRNVDGHREVSRLKVAAVLNTLMDGEVAVTRPAWDMAGVVLEASDMVRLNTVRAELSRAESQAVQARAAEHSINDRAQELAEQDAVERVAAVLAPKLPTAWEPLSLVTSQASGRDRAVRKGGRVSDAIYLLESQRLAVIRPNPSGRGHQIKARAPENR